MSLSQPSFVSPTTGLMDTTSRFPGISSIVSTRASAARHTLRVPVRRIGVSIQPSSLTCERPTSLPNPFPTTMAPCTLSRNRFPACGRTAVTPVRSESPLHTVTCPTRTPATSVMASSGPGGSAPITIPASRTLG
jgi:hypothetical protein